MNSHLNSNKKRLNVKSKAHLYECMQRNGWYMPSINSTLVTVKYMLDVKDGNTWCPRYQWLKMRPCPRPPIKLILIQEIHKELSKFKEARNTGIDEKHFPDNEWLIVTLATLNTEHRYF